MVRLENVLEISLQDVLKMPWRRLEDVLKTPWRRLEDVLKTSWRHLEDVLKTYGQDEYIGLDQDVLKTSSEDVRLRRTYLSWSRRLEDVLKTSSSRQMFAGIHFLIIWWQCKCYVMIFLYGISLLRYRFFV